MMHRSMIKKKKNVVIYLKDTAYKFIVNLSIILPHSLFQISTSYGISYPEIPNEQE